MTENASSNLPDRYRKADLDPRGANRLLPGAVAAATADNDRLDLRALYSIFRRRRTMFLLIVAIFFLLALNFTLLQQKMYQASASVVLDRQSRELVRTADGAQTPDEGVAKSEDVDTEIKRILSQNLAETVVRNLRLDREQDFLAKADAKQGVAVSIARKLGLGTPRPRPADPVLAAAKLLTEGVGAQRMDNAFAIAITYSDTDPNRAARIANGYAAAYTASAVEEKRGENKRSLELLSQRIGELRNQAQADFKAVQDFRVANNLLSAQPTQLNEQQASAFGQQLAAARSTAALNSGRESGAGGAEAAAAASSGIVQSLRSQRAAISVKVAEMSGRYLETHPDLVSARRELSDIDAQIAAETGRVRAATSASLASEARASAQQAGAMAGGFSAARSALAANNHALVGLDDLNRKAQTSQSLYESYLNRYKEVLAQMGSEHPVASLLSAASVPQGPISPNLPLNLALGLLLGTLVGASAAIATESAYSGLTTRDDVEQRLGVRFLGGVPEIGSIGLRGSDPLASTSEVRGSAYAESVRGLLASIRQSGASRNQVIAVTSALPGEGKSTLAASMVRLAAFSGHSAILIDCDPVRQRQGKLFGIDSNRPGLREMLRGGVRLGEAMVKDPHSEAMIVPITTMFGDGERLLEGGNFHQMIAMLREHFSLIVLDCAPILPVAEVRELVTLADNVAICAAWRGTPDTAVRAALQLLPMHALGDVGVVLTRIDMNKQVRFGVGDPGYFYEKYKQYYVGS
jgi:polysaccharide biosynthesis transport protein